MLRLQLNEAVSGRRTERPRCVTFERFLGKRSAKCCQRLGVEQTLDSFAPFAGHVVFLGDNLDFRVCVSHCSFLLPLHLYGLGTVTFQVVALEAG